MIKLSTPRFRVVLGDSEDPSTWQELHVQAHGIDMTSAEQAFRRRKWGTAADVPIRFQRYIAYLALRRTGRISGEWDAFDRECIEALEAEQPQDDGEDGGDEDDAGGEVGPTGRAPGPG